jgi:hypothetical protein
MASRRVSIGRSIAWARRLHGRWRLSILLSQVPAYVVVQWPHGGRCREVPAGAPLIIAVAVVRSTPARF